MENNNQLNSQFSQPIPPTYNPKGARFAFASFIFGILSITCGLFLFWTPLVLVGFTGGGFAILFAILSKGNYKQMESRAKSGFIFGIIGPIVTTIILTIIIITSFYFLRNDESIREATRESLATYEDTLKDLYGEEVLADYENTYGKEFDLEKTFDQLFEE